MPCSSGSGKASAGGGCSIHNSQARMEGSEFEERVLTASTTTSSGFRQVPCLEFTMFITTKITAYTNGAQLIVVGLDDGSLRCVCGCHIFCCNVQLIAVHRNPQATYVPKH